MHNLNVSVLHYERMYRLLICPLFLIHIFMWNENVVYMYKYGINTQEYNIHIYEEDFCRDISTWH